MFWSNRISPYGVDIVCKVTRESPSLATDHPVQVVTVHLGYVSGRGLARLRWWAGLNMVL